MPSQIVFFEMNYMFTTGAERTAVIEDLRKPEIKFPPTWKPHLDRQRKSKYSYKSPLTSLTPPHSHYVAPST
jgi:hypothetical protein